LKILPIPIIRRIDILANSSSFCTAAPTFYGGNSLAHLAFRWFLLSFLGQYSVSLAHLANLDNNTPKLSKSCQKAVKKLSKSCQQDVKKLSKSCQNLSKICQKVVKIVVKKIVKKLSKSCQKVVKKVVKTVVKFIKKLGVKRPKF
jgi:DNA repair ATPase RecN